MSRLNARTPSPSHKEPECEPRPISERLDLSVNGIGGGGESILENTTEEYDMNATDLTNSTSSDHMMLHIMEEYEKTIAYLINVTTGTKAQLEKYKETMKSKLDMTNQHLKNMEIAFNDIHQKYEELKIKFNMLQSNEEELKKNYDAAIETVAAQEIAYQKLKQNASEKINAANATILQMEAEAKKKELKCKFMENALARKSKHLQEMTEKCDKIVCVLTWKSKQLQELSEMCDKIVDEIAKYENE